MSEYDPTTPETAIATPAPAPAVPPVTTGEGYDKALNSERNIRKALEQRNKAIEAELAENKRALEQAQMTLEQKAQAEVDAIRQNLQSQVDAIAAEKDAKLQAEYEARMTAEQRLQLIENQSVRNTIVNTFASAIAPLLVDPNEDMDYFLKTYGDNLTYLDDGRVVARDGEGNLAPIEDLVQFAQAKHPKFFKPPARQNTGGGARNLATSNVGSSQQRQEKVAFTSLAEINANPQKALAHMDDIIAGRFQLGDR